MKTSSRISSAAAAVVLLALFLHALPAQALNDNLTSNRSTYIAGETHLLSAAVSHTGAALNADVYLVLVPPGGAPLFVQFNPANGTQSFFVGSFANPATWRPFLSNVPIANGLNLSNVPLFQYTFAGIEPLGNYTWYLAFTQAGTLQFVGNIASASFTYGTTVSLLVGTWQGTWTDTVFNVSGTLQFTLMQSGGMLNASGSIDLQSVLLANATISGSGVPSAGGNMVSFTFNAPPQANGMVMLNGRAVSGRVTTVPFGAFDISGSLQDNSLSGTFTYDAGGAGNFSITRQ